MKEFGFVLATKKLVEEQLPVMFMYREKGENGDSGWRFFAGIEDQEYVDNPQNIGIYDIQTIVDIDDSILPYLDSVEGSAYERDEATKGFLTASEFDFKPEGGEV